MARRQLSKLTTSYTTEPDDFITGLTGISMAMPDLSLSCKDLLQRYTLGTLPAEVVRTVVYSDNPDFDDIMANELPDFDLADYSAEVAKLRSLHERRQEERARVASEAAAAAHNAASAGVETPPAASPAEA